jgi:hypothetical protein
MIWLVKTISTEFDNLKRRVVKVLRSGKSDVQTAFEAAPFGIDSNPLKDMIALYAPTTEKGKTVIIGYLRASQLKAAIGETRLYSTDGNGTEKTFLWLKNDGTIEVGGSTDFMVRYSKLEEAFNDLKDKWNTFANAYSPGGPSTQGAPISATASNADISQCKIEQIKTL